MSKTVVCPLSENPTSERALPSAFDVTTLLDADIELVSVVEDRHMVGRRSDEVDTIAANRRDSFGPVPKTSVIVDPHAPRALAERSQSPAVTMVMATSSQPLLHTGYVGSAAEKVIRVCANPAVLIGPHNTTRVSDVERIVVPCDGSQLSEAALEPAQVWAELLAVPIWVVTSLAKRDQNRAGFNADAETAYVRRLAGRVGGQWEVLHGDDPAKTITHWAGPALTVMTTHGRSGLSRITIGSVTTAVTRWAHGPVVVANSHDRFEGADTK